MNNTSYRDSFWKQDSPIFIKDPTKVFTIDLVGLDVSPPDPRPALRARLAKIKWWKLSREKKANLLAMINSPDLENVTVAEVMLDIKEGK